MIVDSRADLQKSVLHTARLIRGGLTSSMKRLSALSVFEASLPVPSSLPIEFSVRSVAARSREIEAEPKPAAGGVGGYVVRISFEIVTFPVAILKRTSQVPGCSKIGLVTPAMYAGLSITSASVNGSGGTRAPVAFEGIVGAS